MLSETYEKSPEVKSGVVSPQLITEDEYIIGWKKVKTDTSSNPISPNYPMQKIHSP